jgi:BlaI family penicillinase repressor
LRPDIAEETRMSKKLHTELSKRERQIMDVIYQKKSATAKEVMERIPNPPSYSTVRKLLNILEGKGFLKHIQDGIRYIYYPKIPHKKAMRSAIRQLMETYFDNSVEEAMTALIEYNSSSLSDEDLSRLIDIMKKKKREGFK